MIHLDPFFFNSHPRWFRIFHDNEVEESEVFYLSALCFALWCPRQKDFLFHGHSESQEFLLQFSLWLCPLFFFLCHFSGSKANKILLDDRLFIHRYVFLTTDEVFLSIEVNNFPNETFLKYNERPSVQC